MQVKHLSKSKLSPTNIRSTLPALCASLVFSVLVPVQELMAAQVVASTSEQQQQFELDIPAQALASALQALSVASRYQVSAASSVLSGETSLAVKGRYTVLDALQVMISDSNLQIAKIGDNSYTLVLPKGAPEQNRVQLEEIMVTGQKITRSLQDTPTSVAVITPLQFEQKNINTFSESLFETANAHSTPFGGFSIRGIDGSNVSGGGNSFLASVYVDGASLPRRLISGGGFSTWDAAQVEILRGPQSTLQGRNALAGAVVMATQKPSQEWDGQYRLQVGENGQKEAAIAVGGGLIEDTLAVRFSAEKKETDGYNTNVTRNEPADFREDELYRLKFLLTPQSLPDFSAELNLTHASNERGPVYITPSTSGSLFDQRSIFHNTPEFQYVDADLAALKLDYAINDTWSFTSITAYSDVDSGLEADDDRGAVDSFTRLNTRPTETLNQELRFSVNTDKLSGVIGAYYSDEKTKNTNIGQNNLSLASVGLNVPFLQGQFGLDAGTAGFVIAQYANLDPVILQADGGAQQAVSSYALFTDMTYSLNEQWDIFGGLRWDHETQESASEQSITILNAQFIPDPSLFPAPLNQLIGGINQLLVAQADAASATAPLTDASFSSVLPKLGVSYHWNDDVTTSFTVQEGYRSGGVGVNSAQFSAYTYDAESTINYEFSLRSVWLDGVLTANANVFYIDWSDQQVDVQLSANTFDLETRNAGSSSIEGFELELNYLASDALTVYGSVGQANSEFKDFEVVVPSGATNVVFDLSGRSFAASPEWTANIGTTYTNGSGVFANMSANYANSAPAVVNPFATGLTAGSPGFDLQNESRVLVNMQLGYEWDNMGVYLIGKNILDEEYIASNHIRFITLGAPRQLSLSLRGSF